MRSPVRLRMLLIALVLALACAPASAGLYHRYGDLACSDCHVMHYDQPGAGPYPKLLKESATQLCLSCHDGKIGSGDTAPDVMQDAGSGQPAHRAGGAFQALPGQPTLNGHSLLVDAVPPGGTTSMSLTCLSCHSPHGNGNYRNLMSNPGGKSGLAVTAVSEVVTTPTSAQYSIDNIRYTSSDGGISSWCAACHGDIHGAGGAANMGGSSVGDTNQDAVSPWLRHPVRDVTMAQGQFNQHVDPSRWFGPLSSRVPVVSASKVIPGTPAGSDNQVFCSTCHKAHGSSHRYGLIWDTATTVEPEDGAAQMETCQQCHNK